MLLWMPTPRCTLCLNNTPALGCAEHEQSYLIRVALLNGCKSKSITGMPIMIYGCEKDLQKWYLRSASSHSRHNHRDTC